MKHRLAPRDLHGIHPAIPTPVTADDAIDPRSVQVLLDYLIEGGVNGVVPLGGTGEYCSLPQAQRERMVSLCAEAAGGRVPVIAGILEPGFHDASASGRAFAAAGASAVLLLTPYYTTPTQRGIRDYFLRFAEASPVPVVLYEIPYRTRVALDPELVHELSHHDNIIGIKACNTDMFHFLKLVAGVSDDFSVLSGEDVLFPLQMAAGAKGGIIVTSSVLPRTWRAMYVKGEAGRHAEAVAMHRKLLPLLDLVFAETNPGPLKSVWELVGVETPHVLAPLAPAAGELQQKLRAELAARLKDEAGMRARRDADMAAV